jgi:Family of unknown function (DUF5681)
MYARDVRSESKRRVRGRPFAKGQSGNPRGRVRGSKNKPRRKALPLAGTIAAAELARMGTSESEIAKLLQAKPSAVKAAVAEARALLELFAPHAAECWLEAARVAALDGNHKPAMALMQAIEAVKPPAQSYDTGGAAKAIAGVKVELHGFYCAGLPGLPAGLAPGTNAEPVTVDVTASDRT